MVTWDPQALCLKKRNDFKEKTSKNFHIYLPAFFKYFCTCVRLSLSVPGTTRCTEELRAHLPQPTPEVTTGLTTERRPGGRSSLRPLSQVCTTKHRPRGRSYRRPLCQVCTTQLRPRGRSSLRPLSQVRNRAS